MLKQSQTTTLATIAEEIIQKRLLGMRRPATTRGAHGKLEVPALEDFLFEMAPRIAGKWRKVIAPEYNMHLTSVLCHQRPMATYRTLGQGYGLVHQSQLPAARPWTCELADLLVVMEFRVRGRSYLLRQAGLIQAKDGVFGKLSLGRPEYKQHHLLACWPEFTLPGISAGKTWRLRGLTPQASRYGLIDPPSGRWTIHSTDPGGPELLHAGGSFGMWLARLATGTDGAAADPGIYGWWRPAPANQRDWRDLVDDLLDKTGKGIFHGYKRRQSQKIRFLTAADLDLEDEADTESWMTFVETSDQDLPPRGEVPISEGPGGMGVLHIRFDPAEG
jgi:hypothetical protein